MNNLLLQKLRGGETLVFGHRGASAYAPMNTLEAFQLAAEMGAHGVELDVHRSADGHAVIVHDFTVDASTDGSGEVNKMTLATLKALDAGSWKSQEYRGALIPTLDEVFETVGQKLFVNVEIKSRGFRTDGVEQVTANTIRRHQMESRVIVSSFNPLALRRFRRILPEVPLGYLTAVGMPLYVRLLSIGMQTEAIHPHHSQIDAEYMARAREKVVNTWTVNDAERARELRDLGVGVIISDKPDVILDALAE
jgi:glycerophosphoryl diester phosphodiesterase